jgi:hypothetical protein
MSEKWALRILYTAEEMAAVERPQAVVWLCSAKAWLILGVALPGDGGYTVV